jgi:hypothetical protein
VVCAADLVGEKEVRGHVLGELPAGFPVRCFYAYFRVVLSLASAFNDQQPLFALGVLPRVPLRHESVS